MSQENIIIEYNRLLLECAKNNNETGFMSAFNNDANLSVVDSNHKYQGWNSLHWACYHANDFFIQRILQKFPAMVNSLTSNQTKNTPLHILTYSSNASKEKKLKVIRFLLENGADPYAINCEGQKAIAAYFSNYLLNIPQTRVRVYFWSNNYTLIENLKLLIKSTIFRIIKYIPFLSTYMDNPSTKIVTGHIAIALPTGEYFSFWPGNHGTVRAAGCHEVRSHFHKNLREDIETEGAGFQVIDLYSLDIVNARAKADEICKTIQQGNWSVSNSLMFPFFKLENQNNCCTATYQVLSELKHEKLLNRIAKKHIWIDLMLTLLLYFLKQKSGKYLLSYFSPHTVTKIGYALNCAYAYTGGKYVVHQGTGLLSSIIEVCNTNAEKYKSELLVYKYSSLLFILPFPLFNFKNIPMLSFFAGIFFEESKKLYNTLYSELFFTPRAFYNLVGELKDCEEMLYPYKFDQKIIVSNSAGNSSRSISLKYLVNKTHPVIARLKSCLFNILTSVDPATLNVVIPVLAIFIRIINPPLGNKWINKISFFANRIFSNNMTENKPSPHLLYRR